jgi:hypothetical protein
MDFMQLGGGLYPADLFEAISAFARSIWDIQTAREVKGAIDIGHKQGNLQCRARIQATIIWTTIRHRQVKCDEASHHLDGEIRNPIALILLF